MNGPVDLPIGEQQRWALEEAARQRGAWRRWYMNGGREKLRDYQRQRFGHRPRLSFDCIDCGAATRSYVDAQRCERCRGLYQNRVEDPDWRPGMKSLRIRPCTACGIDVVCRAARTLCPECRAAAEKARRYRKTTNRNGVTRSQRSKLALRPRLLKRFGGLCGICHLAIDVALRWPHPLSCTLDHIIPLSAGGPDTEENLWPAHRRCNEEKADDIGYRPDSVLFPIEATT